MGGRKSTSHTPTSKPKQRRDQFIDPAVRELLDLLAEELAAEYLRLLQPDRPTNDDKRG